MIENLRLIKQEIKKATNEGRRPLQREAIKEPLKTLYDHAQQVKAKDELLAKDIFCAVGNFRQSAEIPYIVYQGTLKKVESLLVHFSRVGLISGVGEVTLENANG